MDLNILTPGAEILNLSQNVPNNPTIQIIQTDNSLGSPDIQQVTSQNELLQYGSFHCDKYKKGKKCELCSHMMETNFVYSHYFKTKFRIHGHLSHDYSITGRRRWYIYLIEDLPCNKAIVGSTTDPYNRWTTHKSNCNKGPCKSTGLAKHFTLNDGCPNDPGRRKETLNFVLVDFMDVSEEELQQVRHEKGPKCRCSACSRLKDIEDQWILKMGTFYGESGLNERDEIQAKTRFNWKIH